MKIKKMTANFGNLKNRTLELDPGFNVIYAPNEYGKSTWCAFIKAMLYGIDSSERDRAGHLAAKSRYKPWDGSPMAGTMDISHEGRDITIQRTNGSGVSGAPFKNLLAVYTGTAEFIKTLTPDTAGEQLTGVSEHVFERTAYIRRPEMRVSQTSDLEKRISSLIFSGDEQASYSDADGRLRAWQRKLRYNKNGSIPQLEAEKREAEAKMDDIAESARELGDLRSNIQRLQAQVVNLEADLETHEKLEKRAAARRIIDTEKKVKLCEERLEKLRAEITRGGRVITRQDLSEIRETASSVVPLRRVRQDAEKALAEAERELSDLKAKLAASPLSGTTEEDAIALSRSTAELEVKVDRIKKRRVPRWIPVTLITLGVILALVFSGILAPFGEWIPAIAPFVRFRLFGVAAALIFLAAGTALFFIKPSAGDLERELKATLDKYGVASADKLSSLVTAYTALLRGEAPLTATRDAARSRFSDAATASQEAEDKAVRAISEIAPDVKSGPEVMAALRDIEERIEEVNRAEFDLTSTRSVYDTLLHQFGGEVPEIDDSYIPQPLRDKEDTMSAVIRAKAQLTEAIRRYDVLSGERMGQGDPAVVESKIDSINERIREEETKYSALGLAISTLSEVNTELTTRFSPLISKKAGEYMERLTDGQYEKLSFDRGFDATARTMGDLTEHSVLSLSDGTVDEIYFSLRLAMCELILTGDDPAPIILDDALLNFDDGRMAEALDLLAAVSETRQVILFSCHSREADMLEGKAGVNVIRG